jgi:hypothetical protein
MIAIRNPAEAFDHIRTQLSLIRAAEHERLPVETDPEWRQALHAWLGVEWPCGDRNGFARLWETLQDEASDLSVGLAHDGDPTLGEAVWCLTRHMKPAVVVETGVSRGVTSRLILEALELNGTGRLWSVDLPPLEEPWRRLVGSAVPDRLRHRWTYVRGTSQRHLARVCADAGSVDLFIHDSLHTPGNLQLEVETVWPMLTPHAAIVIDDAELCRAGEALSAFAPALLAARDELKRDAVGFILR